MYEEFVASFFIREKIERKTHTSNSSNWFHFIIINYYFLLLLFSWENKGVSGGRRHEIWKFLSVFLEKKKDLTWFINHLSNDSQKRPLCVEILASRSTRFLFLPFFLGGGTRNPTRILPAPREKEKYWWMDLIGATAGEPLTSVSIRRASPSRFPIFLNRCNQEETPSSSSIFFPFFFHHDARVR